MIEYTSVMLYCQFICALHAMVLVNDAFYSVSKKCKILHGVGSSGADVPVT